jgi:hypothetical protein
MAKETPAAMFRQAPPTPSTTAMADFVARAAPAAPQLAIVPTQPEPPAQVLAQHSEHIAEREEETKAATIRIPIPPANEGNWRTKTVRRVDGRELRKQTFYLDASISQRLAQHCAKYHYEQSKAVERAVLALLEACGD